MNLKTRYIEHIGTVAFLRIYWEDFQDGNRINCPSGWSYHNGEFEIARSNKQWDDGVGGTLEDHKDDPRWPVKCDRCGKLAPLPPYPLPPYEHSLGMVMHQIFRRKLFNTTSGSPEPGDLYYVDYECWGDNRNYCISGWSNCNGKHLHCVLPNGQTWDINSRATNCTRREDKEHRCWVLHGDPTKEPVFVDKNGNSCQAGAGSIMVPGWHGFLKTNGILTEC